MTVLFLPSTTSQRNVFPMLEKFVQNFHLILKLYSETNDTCQIKGKCQREI